MPYKKQAKKKKTTVRVPEHLLDMAKAYGISVSQFLTIRLREFFSGQCVYRPLPDGAYRGEQPAESTVASRATGPLALAGSNPALSADAQSQNATRVSEQMLEEHIDFLRCEGLSDKWLDTVQTYLRNWLDAVEWDMAKSHTLDYLKRCKEQDARSTYRKKLYQIRKFLQNNGQDWAEQLKAPKERNNNDITVWRPDDMQQAYEALAQQDTHRYTAALMLAATSGLRPHELYELSRDDIDLQNRTVHVRKSKSGKQRYAFFSERAAAELRAFFAEDSDYKAPFNEHAIRGMFKKRTGVLPKHCRKFFSQEWDRHKGNHNIKQLIMGRSTNGNVDLKHYAAQGVDDLRKAYDDVGVTVF